MSRLLIISSHLKSASFQVETLSNSFYLLSLKYRKVTVIVTYNANIIKITTYTSLRMQVFMNYFIK